MSVMKIRDANGNFVGIHTIKGDKGDKGEQGGLGLYAFHINADGHLVLNYQVGVTVPEFKINEAGHLVATL